MTTERAPQTEEPMLADQPGTTPWTLAHERLANPEPGRTSWLATVRPDGSPHLMPIIAFWIDGAFHFVVGEGTRKGRNLAADGRCVVATGSTTLPSLDVIVEGRAEPIEDEAAVARLAETLKEQQLAAGGARRPGLRPQRPDGRSAAVLDLPDGPVQGVRPARDAGDGTVRPVGASEADALGVRRHLSRDLRVC